MVQNKLWDAAYKIMDINVWGDTTYSKNYLNISNYTWTGNRLPALATDKLDLKVFFGNLLRMKGVKDFSRQYMIQQDKRAERLIKLLRTKLLFKIIKTEIEVVVFFHT